MKNVRNQRDYSNNPGLMFDRGIVLRIFTATILTLLATLSYAQETTLTERSATDRVVNWYFTNLSEVEINRKTRDLDARIIDIEVTNTSPMRFTVSMVKNGGVYRGDWSWFYGMSARGLNNRLDEMNARPIDLEVYKKNGQTLFAAITKTNTGSLKTDWFWYHSQTADSLNEKFDRHKMRPIDIERYRDGNKTQYAAIMVDNRGEKKTGWFWYHSESATDVLEKMSRHKMRLLDIERYGTGADRKHVVILTPYSHSTQNSWWYYGIAKSDITDLIRRHGARVIDIEKVSNGKFDVVLLDNGISTQGSCKGRLKHMGDTLVRLMKFNAIPGGQIAVTRNGRLVYSCAFGVADIGSLEKVTPDSRFRIMSVSKLLTNSAINDLVAKGRITKDDRMLTALGNRAPVSPFEDPRVKTIELSQLMSHQGGFINNDPDDSSFYDPMTNQPKAASEMGQPTPLSCRKIMTHAIKTFELGYWPGIPMDKHTDTQRYSNLGYCILQQVVAANSSLSYAKYVQKHILDPAGVKDMEIGRGRLTKRKVREVMYYDVPFAKPVTSPYPADTEKMPRPYAIVVEAMAGHGGWISSANDLVRYGAFTNSIGFEGAIVGTRSVLARQGKTYVAINLNASPTNHSEVNNAPVGSGPRRVNPPKFSLTKFANQLIADTNKWPARDLWSDYGYPE